MRTDQDVIDQAEPFSHMAITAWPMRSTHYLPGFKIGSEDEDGAHRRDLQGWPYSVYRQASQPGGTDACICHGIQHLRDAQVIAAALNGR